MTYKHFAVFAFGALCALAIMTCGGELSGSKSNDQGSEGTGQLLIGVENGVLMMDTSDTDQAYVVLGRTASGGPIGNNGQDYAKTHWSSTADLLAEVNQGDEVWVYRLVPEFKFDGVQLVPCTKALCVPPPPPPPPGAILGTRDWAALAHFQLPSGIQ